MQKNWIMTFINCFFYLAQILEFHHIKCFLYSYIWAQRNAFFPFLLTVHGFLFFK